MTNLVSINVKNIFNIIDSEEKAYFIGYIANLIKYDTLSSGVFYAGDSIVLDFNVIKIFNPAIKSICESFFDVVEVGHFDSIELLEIDSIKDLLSTNNFVSWAFPQLSEELTSHFLRGVVEAGLQKDISHNANDEPIITIKISSSVCQETIDCLKNVSGKVLTSSGDKWLTYRGISAIDFLFDMYKDATVYNIFLYDLYTELGSYSVKNNLSFNYEKTSEDAVAPMKSRASDSGYDLTAIKIAKVIDDVVLYDTGIKVRPPYGWYFDLVPRSSIIKSGYMLANSVGIIDSGFCGNIMIALRKVNHNAKDLELPIRIAQLIPRQIVNMEPVEVECLEKTERDEKGFGSSGK